jgi:hypothetical protein
VDIPADTPVANMAPSDRSPLAVGAHAIARGGKDAAYTPVARPRRPQAAEAPRVASGPRPGGGPPWGQGLPALGMVVAAREREGFATLGAVARNQAPSLQNARAFAAINSPGGPEAF